MQRLAFNESRVRRTLRCCDAPLFSDGAARLARGPGQRLVMKTAANIGNLGIRGANCIPYQRPTTVTAYPRIAL